MTDIVDTNDDRATVNTNPELHQVLKLSLFIIGDLGLISPTCLGAAFMPAYYNAQKDTDDLTVFLHF